MASSPLAPTSNDDGGSSTSHDGNDPVNTDGHQHIHEGDDNLSYRGLAEILPMMDLLALLFRGFRDTENTGDRAASDGYVVSDLDLNHDYRIGDGEDQSEASNTSQFLGLYQRFVDEELGVRGDADDQTQIDLDELPLQAVLEYFLHNVVQIDDRGHVSAPASKAAVAALPTFQFSKNSPEDEDTCCAVCMEVFQCQEEVREMPCKHVYHTGCILPWLELQSSCPLCRSKLPVEESSPGSSFEETSPGTDETDVAIFDFDGDVVHVLSFVLVGSHADEEETQLTQDAVAEAEGVVQDETALVNEENEGRPTEIQNQWAKIGVDNEERKRLEALESLESEAAALKYAEGVRELQESGTFSESASVSNYVTRQDSRDGELGPEDFESRTQSMIWEDGDAREDGDASGGRHDRLESPADSGMSGSWLGVRVRGLLSWVFGLINMDATDTDRQRFSC